MSQKLYFTQRGLDKLREQIRQLEEMLRHLESQVANVAEIGGNQWHDNASYDALVVDIRAVDWRLNEAHQSLNQAVLVGPPVRFDYVVIGTRVRLLRNGEEMIFEVAGHGEFDEELGLISYDTPLVSPIIGKREGDIVVCFLNEERTELKILEIFEGKNDVYRA